jgi:hypothetical protein
LRANALCVGLQGNKASIPCSIYVDDSVDELEALKAAGKSDDPVRVAVEQVVQGRHGVSEGLADAGRDHRRIGVIIGIGHVAQTGKDTAAEALCRDLGFRRVSFADPLKALAKESNPIILSNMMTNVGLGSGKLSKLVDQLGWDAAKVQFPAVRQFLQDLGLGARKVFGQDFWVERGDAGVDLVTSTTL